MWLLPTWELLAFTAQPLVAFCRQLGCRSGNHSFSGSSFCRKFLQSQMLDLSAFCLGSTSRSPFHLSPQPTFPPPSLPASPQDSAPLGLGCSTKAVRVRPEPRPEQWGNPCYRDCLCETGGWHKVPCPRGVQVGTAQPYPLQGIPRAFPNLQVWKHHHLYI